MDFTYQETTELENSFGVDAEYHEQDGTMFVLTISPVDGLQDEAHKLVRNPDTGRLEVHDGDDFDWKAL